ncbi:NrsF family protein, partial [Pseudomonas putida]|uniref:NrsF family protein n=1 Tax=Pseudomonas putida TaxID=303 RepID=UPI0005B78EBB
MKTDDLIALLAAGEGPVDRHALARRLLLALVGGGLAAVLLTVAMFGVRGDLAQVAHTPLFWAKLALPGSLALVALWLTQRLARPGVKGGLLWGLLGLPLLLVWLGAA